MAASILKFTVFLCIALVLFSPNGSVAEANFCERLSKTYYGVCTHDCPCDAKCLREGAFQGSCKYPYRGADKRACFCDYKYKC